MAADLEGRPWRVVEGAETLRWGLNGRVLLVRRGMDGVRTRVWLGLDEAVVRWNRLRDRLAGLLERVRSGALDVAWVTSPADGETGRPDPAPLQVALERLADRDEAALRQDAADFARVYTPVGILPPDQYLAQVIQLTTGCSFNTCTFCSFYRDIPFHIRSPEELRDHLQNVDVLLGRGSALRRSLFLGDANALVIPTERLLRLVGLVSEHYRDRLTSGDLDGLHAFLDGFSGRKKRAADYAALRRLGLKRVTIGLESGHDPLLQWLRKPGSAADVRDAVMAMKEAGLAVTVIVLLGAGGERFSSGHVRDTTDLLGGLPLDADDLVYFSEFVDQPDAPYGIIARQEKVLPVESGAMAAQREAISTGLTPQNAGGPRTAVYDIREFTY